MKHSSSTHDSVNDTTESRWRLIHWPPALGINDEPLDFIIWFDLVLHQSHLNHRAHLPAHQFHPPNAFQPPFHSADWPLNSPAPSQSEGLTELPLINLPRRELSSKLGLEGEKRQQFGSQLHLELSEVTNGKTASCSEQSVRFSQTSNIKMSFFSPSAIVLRRSSYQLLLSVYSLSKSA